jgi:hypothetical protein
LYCEPHYAGTTTDEGGFEPRSFDGNYGDFLNGFADWKVAEGAVVRVGRQELIYGAERTVSVTNWQNSRRTFEGGRLLTTFDDWKADFLYTAFVPVRPTWTRRTGNSPSTDAIDPCAVNEPPLAFRLRLFPTSGAAARVHLRRKDQ